MLITVLGKFWRGVCLDACIAILDLAAPANSILVPQKFPARVIFLVEWRLDPTASVLVTEEWRRSLNGSVFG